MYVSLRLSVTRPLRRFVLDRDRLVVAGTEVKEVSILEEEERAEKSASRRIISMGTWTTPKVGSPREQYPEEERLLQPHHAIKRQSVFCRRPFALSDSVNYCTYHRPNLIKFDPCVPDLVVFQPQP